MSTLNLTTNTAVKKKFPEVNIKQEFQGKLLISKNLLMKVHYIHQVAPRGIEWSGPLVYELLQGNVSSPKDIIIKADNVILADVGTSGYTEYDMSAENPGMDTYFEALASGKKIGHIHTHHNMATFFSGTDTAELHDNAPNHAFYLSLIVNYEDYTKWCAKIAIVGKVKRTGTIKVEQELGGEVSNFEEQVQEDTEALYIIPLGIELDEEAKAYFDEINEVIKKYKPYSSYANTYGVNKGVIGSTSSNNSTNAVVGKSLPLNPKEKGGVQPKKVNHATSGIISFLDIPNNAFSEVEVKNFLAKWLSLDINFKGILGNAISNLYIQTKNEEAKLELLMELEATFEDYVTEYFAPKCNKAGCTFGPAALHCIAMSSIAALEIFKYNTMYKDILEILDLHILPDGHVADATVERLTGISINNLLGLAESEFLGDGWVD